MEKESFKKFNNLKEVLAPYEDMIFPNYRIRCSKRKNIRERGYFKTIDFQIYENGKYYGILITKFPNGSIMTQKTRALKGEETGKPKLNDDKVRKIRKIYKKKHKTISEIANSYNVSVSCITAVVKRKSWSHVV